MLCYFSVLGLESLFSNVLGEKRLPYLQDKLKMKKRLKDYTSDMQFLPAVNGNLKFKSQSINQY